MADSAIVPAATDTRKILFLITAEAKGINGASASLFIAWVARLIVAGDRTGQIKERWPSGLSVRRLSSLGLDTKPDGRRPLLALPVERWPSGLRQRS